MPDQGMTTAEFLAKAKEIGQKEKEINVWVSAHMVSGILRATHRLSWKKGNTYYHTGIDDEEHTITAKKFLERYPNARWFGFEEE